jgi:hypothetical protein
LALSLEPACLTKRQAATFPTLSGAFTSRIVMLDFSSSFSYTFFPVKKSKQTCDALALKDQFR